MDLTCRDGLIDFDVSSSDELLGAILISLFSNKRVDEAKAIHESCGGYWGDLLGDPGKPVGSELWLLRRVAPSDETLDQARRYAAASLQWLLDDGHVAAIDVRTSWDDDSNLLVHVAIDGDRLVSLPYGRPA